MRSAETGEVFNAGDLESIAQVVLESDYRDLKAENLRLTQALAVQELKNGALRNACALAESEIGRLTQALDFQRERADKWVAIAARDANTIQDLQDEATRQSEGLARLIETWKEVADTSSRHGDTVPNGASRCHAYGAASGVRWCIDQLTALVSPTQGVDTGLCVCGHNADEHGNDGAGACGASRSCRAGGCKKFALVSPEVPK